MSTPLGAEDQYLLDYNGWLYVHSVVGVICESIWWSIYVMLFIYAAKIQLSRGIRTMPAVAMLIVTLVLFASSSSLWAMNVAVLIHRLQGMLIDYPDLSLWDRIAKTNERVVGFGLPMEALFLINMLVGDSVVIWRAWVLWQGSGRMRALLVIPITFLCVSFAFMVKAVKCLADDGFSQSTIPAGGRLCAWSEPISWGVSLLTNVVSTTLIAVKAWQIRQSNKRVAGKHSKTKSERILVLLVESGFIYCLFWLSQLILFFDFELDDSRVFGYDILSTLGDQLSGLYPTIIIILVNKHRSLSYDTRASAFVDSGHNGSSSTELPTIQFGAHKTSTVYPQTTTLGTMAFGQTVSLGTTQSTREQDGV
ncbi:hypothetical protein CYLTODRAFT_421993 [Cylindrobasidium torrendii FP15055 ss-10]|uniref:Family A G protein-coupled receptor-like protein n=1 Tax=Cylindrobasidium torrendii FP15055 ss-10 TaxID=1314674 RepID=A0A0D7BBY0_9AGAR|nr:hypothetical protein CYLTODRAFT_421993 [Cylindrobasidium torrendii FP15055 ss-10]